MSSAIADDNVIDIPTRNGVTQRFLLIRAPEAKAAVVLFRWADMEGCNSMRPETPAGAIIIFWCEARGFSHPKA